MSNKQRLGVFKFASCDGCQLSLLNAEDELLELAESIEIAHFLEATSRIEPEPYDIALVEGSITTPVDYQRIQEIRKESKLLITIGACATAGGIQALRNGGKHEEFLRAVYPQPDFIETLATSTPIAEHVTVDFELRGCPVNTQQLVQLLSDLIHQRRPSVPGHSVCRDCKLNGTVCITVAQGLPCLGPVTHSGCGAICPQFSRGCYGCFGPAEQANVMSLMGWLQNKGHLSDELVPLLSNFNNAAPAFHAAKEQLIANCGGDLSGSQQGVSHE
ncbi:MAG: oxidoreductase [Planctomycetaceae bacterium]|nr:oxidoreductase [Planctomycetaceae bacterium]